MQKPLCSFCQKEFQEKDKVYGTNYPMLELLHEFCLLKASFCDMKTLKKHETIYEVFMNDYGSQQWYLNGKCHRENDMPATIYSDGTKRWYINGKYHRENDMPAVIHGNGSKEWWVNGKFIKKEIK